MNKKKLLKLLALAVALALIAGIAWFANGLVGNPISKGLANRAAQAYLSEVYGATDFYLDRLAFSFKDGNYYAFVKSPTSVDTEFTLCYDAWGKLRYDTYDSSVLSKWNTLMRLQTEYLTMVKSELNRSVFLSEEDWGGGTLIFWPEFCEVTEPERDYALYTDDLEIDGIYDVSALGAQAGELTLYVHTEDRSPEFAAQLLLKLKETMAQAGIGFRAVDLTLQMTKPEEGWPDGYDGDTDFYILRFPIEDIYPEGLEERLIAANQEAIAYYAARDKENEAILATAPAK